MGLRVAVVGILLSLCQSQIFSPSFAVTSIPIPLGFPRGFTTQTLFPLLTGPPPKGIKKATPGTYNPFPSPPDPAANQALTNLLTSAKDKKIDGKKEKEVKALFDQGSFRNFNLEMSAQNIAIMSQDPTKELRVHCRLTTDYNTPQAKVFSDFAVGCGYKGSVGSLRVCLDEYHHDNHVCRKLSLRVDARAFDIKSPNKTNAPLFYGMRTLEFAGMPVDLSMMSERTSYYLMNSLGLDAPLAVHAKLFMNGKYLGVYAFIQSVDEEFTEIHFGKDKRKGKGALYKELWFNPLHMQDLDSTFVSGAKTDGTFMREVMSAIQSTPLTGNAPQQFFDKYFDTKSLIDMTAFNTVIGDTDDWRQRHNFYLYVKQDGSNKKIVWIPWDYDRLYDTGSDTRGALRGKAWWDIQGANTPGACNQEIKSAQDQANAIGGTPEKIAWNRDIFDQFPLDINIPVTCDKLTQLMAAALATKIRQRTRDFAAKIDMNKVRSLWTTWNAQIQTALEKDPSGPAVAIMLAQQKQLDQHLTNSLTKAVNEANLADGISSFSSAGSTTWTPVSTFTPKTTTSFPVTFTPASSFTPSSSSFSSTSFTPASSFTSTIKPAATSSFSSTSFPSTPIASSFSPFSSTTISTPSFSSFPSTTLSSSLSLPLSSPGIFG